MSRIRGLALLLGGGIVLAGIAQLMSANSPTVSAASLTITIPTTPLTVDVPADGTFAKSSTPGSITVKTDASWGYQLTLKPKSSADLVSTTGSSTKLTPIPAALTEANYRQSGNDNTWGVLPSKYNGAENTTTFYPISSGITLEKTATPSPNGISYSFTLGAKTTAATPSGAYQNTFTVSAIANSVSYNITYHANNGSNPPAPTSGTTTGNVVALQTAKPTRPNYEFVTWCTKQETGPTCTGTSYAPGANFTLTNSDNKVTLYAVWKETSRNYKITYNSTKSGFAGMPAQQSGTASVSNGFVVTLSNSAPSLNSYIFEGWCDASTDNESCSGKPYAQGATWTVPSNGAILNLYARWRYNPNKGNLGNLQDFSCSKLNVGDYATLTDTRDHSPYKVARLKDDKCWTIDNMRISGTTLTSTDSDVTGNYTLPPGSASSFNPGDTSAKIYNNSDNNAYYNWLAATAGTGTSSLSSGDATGSVCPHGWDLPEKDQYVALANAYGNNGSALMASPVPHFTAAGGFDNSSIAGAGGYGNYWSSTALDNGFAHYFLIASNTVDPQGYLERWRGRTVRCIAW